MKDKPRDQPSGRHPFDQVCANNKIDHRLTKPYRPQTNGLVERFNRRIVEAIAQQPKRGVAHRLFISHADRDTFLNRFVSDYNRTRLKCLGYLAPIQALTNPPGPNTFAETSGHTARIETTATPLLSAQPRAGRTPGAHCLRKSWRGRHRSVAAPCRHSAWYRRN